MTFDIGDTGVKGPNKLILIGHNDSGKTNVLRLIELMLSNGFKDIDLNKHFIRNINGQTSPLFSLEFRLRTEFQQRLFDSLVLFRLAQHTKIRAGPGMYFRLLEIIKKRVFMKTQLRNIKVVYELKEPQFLTCSIYFQNQNQFTKGVQELYREIEKEVDFTVDSEIDSEVDSEVNSFNYQNVPVIQRENKFKQFPVDEGC